MLDSIERILATLWATFARLDIASASSRSDEIGTGRGTTFGGIFADADAADGGRVLAVGGFLLPREAGARGGAAAEPRSALFGAMVVGRTTFREVGFVDDDLFPPTLAEIGPRSTTVGRGGSTAKDVGFVALAGFARSSGRTGPALAPVRSEPCAF